MPKAKSKKSTRKPLSKPKQFCIPIESKRDIGRDRKIITTFVEKLYTNRMWKDPLTLDDFFIVFDTRGRRVCIELRRKINANYIKLEDIHAAIKPHHLRISDAIKLGRPEADILEHHMTKDVVKLPKGIYWQTLSHNGPYFSWIMEPYKPHGTPIQYDGKDYKLTPQEEEVANFWAKRITTDETATVEWTKDAVFRRNFWNDFKKYLTPTHKRIFKDFKKLNFEKIRRRLIRMREDETPAQKLRKKRLSAEKKHDYGFAIVNGIKEAIGNFVIEPAALFLGRGKNKIRGKIKRHVVPEEVTINIGREARIPRAPGDHKWKGVVHDKKARWIMKWSDPITGSNKYVYISAAGQFKSRSDAEKFEKARKLNRYLRDVRRGYERSIRSSNKIQKQLGTVMYLIDHYGIRVGGKNDDSTADTFGASTLLVGHTDVSKKNKVTLEFLGKDSILFKKTMDVSPEVYANLRSFVAGKGKKAELFDRISACDINVYLKSFDKDLSAKVFRTRLASHLMDDALKRNEVKKTAREATKKKAFENANAEVARALNHQRTVTKKAQEMVKKYKKQLKDMQTELRQKKREKRGTKSLETRIQKKKEAIASRENTLNIAINTSKANYIDPRLVTAWTKSHALDVSKVYTKTLQNKFKWAIDTTPADWNYNTSPLLPDYKHLEPKGDVECPIVPERKEKKKEKKKEGKTKVAEEIERAEKLGKAIRIFREESPRADLPRVRLATAGEQKRAIKKFRNMVLAGGYNLFRKEDGGLLVGRTKPIRGELEFPLYYRNVIWDLKELIEVGLKYPALLFMNAICHDAVDNVQIRKIFREYRIPEKLEVLVKI